MHREEHSNDEKVTGYVWSGTLPADTYSETISPFLDLTLIWWDVVLNHLTFYLK